MAYSKKTNTRAQNDRPHAKKKEDIHIREEDDVAAAAAASDDDDDDTIKFTGCRKYLMNMARN